MKGNEEIKPVEVVENAISNWMAFFLLGWFLVVISMRLQLRGHDPMLVGTGLFSGVVAIAIAVWDYRGDIHE